MQHMVLLIIITNPYPGTQAKFAPVCGKYTIQDFQDGGLAGSVVADQCHPFSPFDLKIQIVEQGPGRKGFGKPFHCQHIAAAWKTGFQLDMHIGAGFCGFFQYFDLVQHLFPAFGPANGFFPIEGFQAGDDFLLMADFLLLVQVGLHLGFPKLGFFLGVICVIAPESSDGPLVDLHNLCDDPVQKIPVVGDDDDRALVVHKEGFQPGDGIHVQMVGWLVQHDDIRAGEQKFSKRDSCLLTAGQCIYFFCKIFFFKSQTFQDSGDLAFPGIAVLLFKLMAESGVAVHQLCEGISGGMFHGLFDFPHAGLKRKDFLLHSQKFVEDRVAACHLLVLGQVTDGFSFGDDGLTLVSGQFFHDDF